MNLETFETVVDDPTSQNWGGLRLDLRGRGRSGSDSGGGFWWWFQDNVRRDTFGDANCCRSGNMSIDADMTMRIPSNLLKPAVLLLLAGSFTRWGRSKCSHNF
jgi:hypothetical protein